MQAPLTAEEVNDYCPPFVMWETQGQVRVTTVSFLVWILAIFISARQDINWNVPSFPKELVLQEHVEQAGLKL